MPRWRATEGFRTDDVCDLGVDRLDRAEGLVELRLDVAVRGPLLRVLRAAQRVPPAQRQRQRDDGHRVGVGSGDRGGEGARFSMVTMSYLASWAMASVEYMPVSFAACSAIGILSVGLLPAVPPPQESRGSAQGAAGGPGGLGAPVGLRDRGAGHGGRQLRGAAQQHERRERHLSNFA